MKSLSQNRRGLSQFFRFRAEEWDRSLLRDGSGIGSKPHLVHVFPAFGGGGPEVRAAEIINRSAEAFRHTVLSLCEDVSGQERLDPRCQVQCSAMPDATLWKLVRRLRWLRPDLLLTYGWGGTDAIAAARLAGVGRVVHSEDGFLDDEVERQKLRRRLARRMLFQAAHALVVPSRTLWTIARRQWKVPQRRLKHIPNGVDTVKFYPCNGCHRQALRAELGIADEKIIVGTVGALRPEKNHLRLVRAFAHIASAIPDAHLMVVGAGPLSDTVEREARERGLSRRATFCGRVNDPSRYYSAMDIFALSSDTEQMPLVVLEAMSAGLPVISTDVGDVHHMLPPSNQDWVVPASDPAAFSRALRTLLLDHGLRARLGGLNRRHCVANYSIERMLNTYITLYRELAIQRRRQ